MADLRTALLALALLGCSSAHAPIEPTPTPTPVVPSIEHPGVEVELPSLPAAPLGLDACLGAGGELVEVGAVDNNDVRDHGALLTFGISPDGLLAAAGADGTLKFWTLEAELLATIDGSALTYGSEIGAVPITDLAWDDTGAIAGDVRGLVQQMGPDGTFNVLGGTMPDVPIVAVAFDPTSESLAHAQAGAADVIPLVVRAPEGVHEIRDTLDVITDLAYTRDGALVVAGSEGDAASIELRAAGAPAEIDATLRLAGSASIAEVAVARAGDVGVAASSRGVAIWRAGVLAGEAPVEGGRTSIDLTPSGAYALSIGADGSVIAHATDGGREAARVTIADALVVRVDATGQRVIVGGSDAILHVLACATE